MAKKDTDDGQAKAVSPASLELAAQAWTKPETEHLTMEPALATEFAQLLDQVKAEILNDSAIEVELLRTQLEAARAQRDEAAAQLSDAAEAPAGLVGTITIAGAKCVSRTNTDGGANAVFEDNEGNQFEIRHFAPALCKAGMPYDVTITVTAPQ